MPIRDQADKTRPGRVRSAGLLVPMRQPRWLSVAAYECGFLYLRRWAFVRALVSGAYAAHRLRPWGALAYGHQVHRAFEARLYPHQRETLE